VRIKDAKGEIVNIYQKQQTLTNYLIDLCPNEGDWVLDLFSRSGKFYYIKLNFNILFFCFYVFILIYLLFLCLMIKYNTSMFLQKGRNCIAIERDPLQCNFIQKRINALQFLQDEMQEVGLRKGEFNESCVTKKAKEPQPPLYGMFRK